MRAGWRDSFEDFRMDVEEIIDGGDDVIVMAAPLWHGEAQRRRGQDTDLPAHLDRPRRRGQKAKFVGSAPTPGQVACRRGYSAAISQER
jgi:hypothetical protein